KGNYVDDIQLPGMLHMDIVRSPYAHAKIKSINAERALKIPGVLAVITGETLAKYNLHWMPTLMSDTQMVLPTEKVMYQAQEVAAVIATDRYIAADGVEAVEVEYDPLPVVVDPFKALDPSAPGLRTDKKGKKDNRIFHWQAGDRTATDKAFAEADVVVAQDMYIPRIHVASIETCGCVADFDRVNGKLTVYMTTQAPHAVRTVFALVAGHVGLSEEKIRIVSPDIGGGFGGKVPVYPGYVIAVAASVVIGKPVKWVEDRMENLQADSFARDYHIHAELAASKDGTMKALRIKTLADHGYTDAAANPSKFPAGLFSICTGSYDLKNAFAEVDGVYTNKAPGGAAQGDGHRRLRGAAQGAGGEARPGRADGHRHLQLHRDRRGGAEQAVRHPWPEDVRLLRDPDPSHGQGDGAVRHQVAGPGARDHVRADRRRGAGHPSRARAGGGGRPRHGAVRARDLREPVHADRRRRGRDGGAQDPREGEEDRRAPVGVLAR